MSRRLPLSLSLALPFALSAALSFGAVSGPLEQALQTFMREGRAYPEGYLERAERAWTNLARGPVRAWMGGRLDTLAALPSEDILMRELRAYYMHQLVGDYENMLRERHAAPEDWDQSLRTQYALLRRQYKKSETRARFDADTASLLGPGWPRFQADLALDRADTAAALRAYRSGWKRFDIEQDYISLIQLYRAQGRFDAASLDALLEEGLRAYPVSPGVHAAVFTARLEGGRAEDAGKALAIAARGQGELWPESVDWKIRYARALMASGKSAEVDDALLGALGLLEEDRILKSNAPEALRLRREIFALMQSPSRDSPR